MVRENRPVTAVGWQMPNLLLNHNTQPPCQHPLLCSSCAWVFTVFPSGPLLILSGMSVSDLCELLYGEEIKGWQSASTWEMVAEGLSCINGNAECDSTVTKMVGKSHNVPN